MKMLDATDVADAIVYALTRPDHVCVNDIQLSHRRQPDRGADRWPAARRTQCR